MPTTTDKSFTPTSKEVRYINRDFGQLKEALISFSKTYFPNTYKDFSPSAPGMMFIEMASYVGDVLSYYTDYAFKEGLIQYATERKNIISLAKYLGYVPKPSKSSTGPLDLFQLCPSKDTGTGDYTPDPDYMLNVKENSQFSNNQGSYYVLKQSVDFSLSSSLSPRVDSVYSRNADGTPQFFILKKQGTIVSGQVLTKQQTITTPSQFLKIYLDEDNVLGIVDVVDSDNNKWYEVDYLAQELVPTVVPNDVSYEGTLSQYKDSIPYILHYLKTSRRFTKIVDENNLTYLEFGAGVDGIDDEIVTFNPALIGVGLTNINNVNVPLDPSNFLKGESYGIAPSNTTLTIRYLVGGGIQSNCASDDVKNIISVDFANSSEGLLPEKSNLLNTVKNSLAVTNPEPCTGGDDAETNEQIKLNAISNFSAQNRAVTREDYLVRVYSLPPHLGSIAKAQVISDVSLHKEVNKILVGSIGNTVTTLIDNNINNYFRRLSYDITNPFSINIYILSYDGDKKLTKPNEALVTNLISYLKQYKIVSDGINIIDGYIINIGVEFAITVYKGFNKKDVLLDSINAVKNFFNIDQWNFSQPINTSQLQLEIAKVEGVQSVVNVKIVNKTILDGNYSVIEYDIKSATKNGIIYPSVDPSIFEVKYPDSDIKGTCL
jgi:hypothetical protein